MIITTTDTIQGYEISEYKGIVSGEVVSGINFVKDMGAGLRNIFGGRSQGYEKEIIEAREQAKSELIERAKSMGANAVIGVSFDMEGLGQNGSMILVSAIGTAVTIHKKDR